MNPVSPDLELLLTQWRERLGTPFYWENREEGLWVRGQADSLTTRREITEAIASLLTTPLVINEITVACADPVSDELIHRYVRTALKADSNIVDETLTVEVSDAIVSLIGDVGSREELARIVDAATTVRGVRGVVNLLQVAPDTQAQDLAIVNQIMTRLAFAQSVDDTMVRVMAAGGEVVLMGRVETDEQRRQVEQIATATEGVASVVNRLEVG